jgi:hypothetical protein
VTKICVATPAYGEMAYMPYAQSLLRLQQALLRRDDQMLHVTVSFSEMSEARNFLLTHWFDKTDASHILFVDTDIAFEPALVLEMLALQKPVVGVVYPLRHLNLMRIVEAAAKGESPPRAIARGHDFAVRPLQGKPPRTLNGFVEVEGCGAGILLVSRACIAEMLKKRPQLSDRTAKKSSPLARDLERLIRAFDPMTAQGVRLADDFSFCHRWRTDCGGEIWARADRAVTHMGPHRYEARIADAAGGGPRLPARVSPAAAGAGGETGKPRGNVARLTVSEGAKRRPRVVRAKLAPPKSVKPSGKKK